MVAAGPGRGLPALKDPRRNAGEIRYIPPMKYPRPKAARTASDGSHASQTSAGRVATQRDPVMGSRTMRGFTPHPPSRR